MPDYAALKKRVEELAAREWDVPAIEARVNKLTREGIPRKELDPAKLLADKQQILDRVQQRAEEYNYFLKSCAKGTALALMEEFGLGNMEILDALALFPGIGGTGNMCGGITGSLVNFGLYFTGGGRSDPQTMSKAMATAQKFMAAFEAALGHRYCADIIERVTIGYKLNPGESDEAMATFAKENGFAKCSTIPGIGARLAAEFIIDSTQRS
jgi:C_GCAxxG_C_C family probable redox protein